MQELNQRNNFQIDLYLNLIDQHPECLQYIDSIEYIFNLYLKSLNYDEKHKVMQKLIYYLVISERSHESDDILIRWIF